MPKVAVPLTVTKINAAKPKEKVFKLSDGGGLQLWIMPTGKKVWRFEWLRPDKKRDTMTFGPYPEIGLADARKMRDEARGWALSGRNPSAERDRRKKKALDHTFENVAEMWHERWKDGRTPRYSAQTWRRLKANVFPALGKVPVHDITASMIIDALTPMEERGVMESVGRMRSVIARVLTFALARGLVENNVAAGTSGAFKPRVITHLRALPPTALPDLVVALQSPHIRYVTRLVAFWQLLTLARPGEAVQAQWGEIDFQERIWTIPPDKMKKRRVHMVPLSDQAFSILNAARSISGELPYIFPGRNNKETHTNREVIRMALNRLKIDSTAHGFRALASTAMNESGLFSPDIIEAALAHMDKDRTRAAYNRAEYIDQRRALLQWWGKRVETAGFMPPLSRP